MNNQGRKRENRKGVVVIVDDRRVELSEISSQPDAKSISIIRLDHASIDLSQIVTPTLEKLKIRNADLTHIDLSPLSICKELSTLEIDGNRGLMNLDLGPLSSCTKLSSLNVSFRSMKELDDFLESRFRTLLLEGRDLGHDSSPQLDVMSEVVGEVFLQ